MSVSRWLLLTAGLGGAAYGLLRLADLGLVNLRGTVVWLVAGVVLHDAVFAPVVIVAAVVGAKVLPRRALAPATVALVVLAPVTVLSAPELGRFGADPRNPTLLDRHYWLGWAALATLVVLAVLLGALARSDTEGTGGGGDGTGAGGR